MPFYSNQNCGLVAPSNHHKILQPPWNHHYIAEIAGHVEVVLTPREGRSSCAWDPSFKGPPEMSRIDLGCSTLWPSMTYRRFLQHFVWRSLGSNPSLRQYLPFFPYLLMALYRRLGIWMNGMNVMVTPWWLLFRDGNDGIIIAISYIFLHILVIQGFCAVNT